MTENKIELKSVSELLGMNFFIPSYQRGYRWTTQQVKDLLDDIQEFIDKRQEGFYCIQPLVVKKNLSPESIDEYKEELNQVLEQKTNLIDETEKVISKYIKWEVIDGQQRLTTIFILLKYLEPTEAIRVPFELEYETRNTKESNSKEFLSSITQKTEKDAGANIDYYHMFTAKQTITSWFEGKDDNFKKDFLSNLLQNVKFIWYESTEKDSIKVFTRLNIGKISLTNAELIKALFLNKSNFQGSNPRRRLQQQEIASEWDTIEYTLQNDEFWLFLNSPDYDKPTRIDFIFDLMCTKNSLKLNGEYEKELGTDDYKTFRYFYFWFKQQPNDKEKQPIVECWKEVKQIFQIFQEWFNDLELYHYVGFLVEQGINLSDIFDNWKTDDQTIYIFVSNYIKPKIKEIISNYKDLNQQYEIEGSPKKTECRPILLLHNIQTIIKQNSNLKENEKYKLPVFYKFPFHLFKKEAWDVEHIDSNTENALETEKEQKEWLKYSSTGIELNQEIKDEIKKFITAKKSDEKPDFSQLYDKVIKSYQSSTKKLSDEDKNKIWNFTLLDASTNRGYGNSIFPAKRRIIIDKDQGIKRKVDNELNPLPPEKGTIAFIPPCTKNVFLKYYNEATNNLREWDEADAEEYLENIKEVLKDFFNNGGQNNEQ